MPWFFTNLCPAASSLTLLLEQNRLQRICHGKKTTEVSLFSSTEETTLQELGKEQVQVFCYALVMSKYCDKNSGISYLSNLVFRQKGWTISYINGATYIQVSLGTKGLNSMYIEVCVYNSKFFWCTFLFSCADVPHNYEFQVNQHEPLLWYWIVCCLCHPVGSHCLVISE